MEKEPRFFSDATQASLDKLKKLSEKYQHLGDSFTMSDLVHINEPLIEPPQLNPSILQDIKDPILGEKLDQICEFNQQLVEANKELVAKLAEAEASHKHDWIKEIGIAVISVALTILATRLGWL